MSDRWPRSPVPNARHARRSTLMRTAIDASSVPGRGASCGAPSAASGSTPGRARGPGPARTAERRTGGPAVGSSRAGLPLPLLIVGAIVAIGTVIFLAQALGADDSPPRVPRPPRPRRLGIPPPRSAGDLVDVQLLRVDALGRAVVVLTEDADALRRSGEEDRAVVVEEAVAAIESYVQVAGRRRHTGRHDAAPGCAQRRGLVLTRA